MAAIAVVRISGREARTVLFQLAGALPVSRVASLRLIRDPASGEVVDRGMVLWMPGPESATGEDLCEFHVHGSTSVLEAVFTLLNGFPDVRPAGPGEFTRRAFANGKMDLVEIEGLADLLAARTESQRKLAVHHLLGNASTVYDDWRTTLIGILARVEAAVDFSDEQDVVERALVEVQVDTAALSRAMLEALGKAATARAVRDGIKVVLAGLPNTGKSSLLNTIAKRDAAIVSSRPGTTRDVIEVMINLDGLPVILTDTAGLRNENDDEIESIGMSRTWKELHAADVVLWIGAPDIAGSFMAPDGVAPDLLVRNKADLMVKGEKGIAVSCLTGAGMDALLLILSDLVKRRYGSTDHAVVVRSRQRQAVAESIRHLNDSGHHGSSHLELRAEELRKAAHSLARVTGRIDVEDLLDSIFSTFCIGK